MIPNDSIETFMNVIIGDILGMTVVMTFGHLSTLIGTYRDDKQLRA